MIRKRMLNVERLEDRLTPTVWGTPWPQPENLTLSFAPDGTDVGGAPSSLFRLLNQVAPTTTWENLFVQAFQTWAQYTNLKATQVPDTGLPFGTPGAPQGDLRFGDIRIGAKPMPPSVVSTSSGFSWMGSSWCGDILLNTNYNFGINGQGTYDLFTDAIHEIGHSLGLGDTSVDTSSIMYAHYTGPKPALSDTDIQDIQAIYGAPDGGNTNTFKGNGLLGNHSLLSAVNLPLAFSGNDQRFRYLVTAGISVGPLTDFYKITSPGTTGSAPLVLRAVAWGTDINLLQPVIHVFDAQGNRVPLQVVGNGNGLYSIQVVSAQPLSTYYVQVGALHPYSLSSIGAYFLGIEFDQNTPFTLAALSSSQLTGANATTSSSLNMVQSGLFEFNLAADTGTASQDAIVTMTVSDSLGNVVISLSAEAGQPPVTAAKYLLAGSYTITFSAKSKSGGALSAVNFWLLGDKFSDPIGPYTTSSSSSSSGSGYTYSGSSHTSSPQQY